MISILDLQLAVINDDSTAIKGLLAELDRRTENEMFLKAAEHFGFRTLEHHGRRLAIRAEIASLMGYKSESGLRMLCERRDLDSVSMGGFAPEVRMLAINELGLHPQDGKTVFLYWDAFLLAGMEGTSPQAQQVKAYLLQQERAARIAAGVLSVKGSKVDHAAKVVSMAARADRIQNAHLRTQVLKYIDEVMDGALGVKQQEELFK